MNGPSPRQKLPARATANASDSTKHARKKTNKQQAKKQQKIVDYNENMIFVACCDFSQIDDSFGANISLLKQQKLRWHEQERHLLKNMKQWPGLQNIVIADKSVVQFPEMPELKCRNLNKF